jgi:MoaA/NifB/PqqE/SkfB family radical SAM enzyme
MKQEPKLRAYVDEKGRLVFPKEVTARYGLKPGAQVPIDERTDNLCLRRPVTQLAKVYIEPTNACNLECRTCIRNSWDEPLGRMGRSTFDRIIEGLKDFSPVPTVFLGGFGEPLSHPDIIEMVAAAKGVGASVELITNGTMLTREMSRGLIEAGLDMLWASLDGATPESYSDVRLGAALSEVLANLASFRDARRWPDYFVPHLARPQMGIVFVVMKRNVADLPSVLRLGSQLGAKRFLVTNLLPYSPEMCDEHLYSRALTDFLYIPSLSCLELPKIDINEITRKSLYQILRSGHGMQFAGADLTEAHNRCPFVEKGAAAISWDGGLSPCLPLMHNHVSFLYDYKRTSQRHLVGNVAERDLKDLWSDPEYQGFRERVQAFEFSPCTFCGGCEFVEGNQEDCFGNTFPTCGGCLWAQGLIRCP